MAGLACGIIGLPNVGKSTLFNALTNSGAKVENYPFCTIDPNVGIIEVPDPRLVELNAVEGKPKAVPAIIELVDIAGLVKGASQGEGRGNQFLEHIHHVDLLIHVVRAFTDANVSHVNVGIDPLADIEVINLELILADLQMAERALDRYLRKARGNDADAKRAVDVLNRLVAHLEAGKPVRTAALSLDDRHAVPDCRFLTLKPVMYVTNVGEDALPAMNPAAVVRVMELARTEGATVVPVCAKVEAELRELDPEDAALFSRELGLETSALDRLVQECYRQLGLITFFTVGDHEVRAWTTHRTATAPEAGAVIHSDFHDLFIRAEVIAFADFRAHGSRHGARERGLMRIEGKEYVVQDGDILFFRIGR